MDASYIHTIFRINTESVDSINKKGSIMELEEYVNQYSAILKAEVEDNWLRGDIASLITDLHNKEKEEKGKSDIIDQFLTKTGEARSTFLQYRWVAKTFEDEAIRHLPVTWTHYRICASVEDPITWLKKAHDNKWSCTKLIDEVKSAKLAKDIAAGITCAQCGKKIEEAVTIGYKRKRRVLCSLSCAQEYIKSLITIETPNTAIDAATASSVDTATAATTTGGTVNNTQGIITTGVCIKDSGGVPTVK
jgi:hypothetical protein